MDIGYLLRILSRRKWLILSVVLASMALVYFMIGRKPEMYASSVIISTGIVNYKGINSNDSDAFVQEYQVQNAFSNLMEFVKSRANVKLLTIAMLKNDLNVKGKGNETASFREPNLNVVDLSSEELRLLNDKIQQINLDSVSNPSFSPELDMLLDKAGRAYGYDNDALLRAMEVKRKGDTDYLTIKFTSESARLSQALANNFTKVFLNYYQNLRQKENKGKVDFYNVYVADKKLSLDSLKDELYNYRKSKSLASPTKQAEELVSQITQLELQLQKARSKTQSSSASVEKLDVYKDQAGGVYAEESRDRLVDKYAIIELKNKVDRLRQENMTAKGKDIKIASALKKAEEEYDFALTESARSIGKSRNKEEETRLQSDIFKEKLNSDLAGIDASKSVTEIVNQINTLKPKLRDVVEADQTMTYLDNEIGIKEKEFVSLNEKLNDYKLAFQTNENPLHVIENAQYPEWPEPNRQLLLSIFGGIVAGTLTTIFLFLLTFFDSSLRSPHLFKSFVANLPLVGAINQVPLTNLDLKTVFSEPPASKEMDMFRESLRKLRNEILHANGKIFLMVSTKQGEGKSLTINALAHALAANHKRVVILDTNFKNPTLSQFADEPSEQTAIINHAIRNSGLTDVFMLKKNSAGLPLHNVDVIANTGINKSPGELLDAQSFKRLLSELAESYDYIFLEAAALNQYSDARELAYYADKIIAVFNSGSSIKAIDKDAMDYLGSLNGKFAGAVLTEVSIKNMN